MLGFAIPILLLTACDPGRHERMKEELLRARMMNKEYVDFTTDSVMKEVADYFFTVTWARLLKPCNAIRIPSAMQMQMIAAMNF